MVRGAIRWGWKLKLIFLKKGSEDFEGLTLDLDATARLPQLFCLQVGFEEAEADSCGGCGLGHLFSSQLSVVSFQSC